MYDYTFTGEVMLLNWNMKMTSNMYTPSPQYSLSNSAIQTYVYKMHLLLDYQSRLILQTISVWHKDGLGLTMYRMITLLIFVLILRIPQELVTNWLIYKLQFYYLSCES